MKKVIIKNGSLLRVNKSYEGESLEQKIERIVSNKEPITDGAPLIYTNRKDGVQPQYDIRTDRFEIAIDGTDTISKAILAKRESKHNPPKIDNPETPPAAPPAA